MSHPLGLLQLKVWFVKSILPKQPSTYDLASHVDSSMGQECADHKDFS